MRSEMTYECHLCSEFFVNPERIKKHFETIHFTKITPCGSCASYFPDLRELFLHARQVHNQNSRQKKKDCKLQCIVTNCDYRTDNGGLLKHHINSHFNVRPFVCPVCKKGFTQKTNMKTHYNRHKKNEYEFKCEPCYKSFNMHDSYLSHLETREHYLGEIMMKKEVNLKCEICKESFASAQDMLEHTALCPATLYVDMPISCTICFKGLSVDINELELHCKEHREEIVCPYCDDDQQFNGSIAFNFHLTKKHNDKVIRRSVCRYCEMVFDTETERNQHIETNHKDERNKHKSRNATGRLLCTFPNCDFSANSEIQAQKHFSKHYKDIDTDMFYKMPLDVQINNEQPQLQKKRGRPRLCDTPITNSSSDSSFNLSDSSAKKAAILAETGTKRRGHIGLKKESAFCALEEVVPKRGRPKKKLTDESSEELMQDFSYEDFNNEIYYNENDDFETNVGLMDNKENILQYYEMEDFSIKEDEITILEA